MSGEADTTERSNTPEADQMIHHPASARLPVQAAAPISRV